jgi:hypothetical protein
MAEVQTSFFAIQVSVIFTAIPCLAKHKWEAGKAKLA